MINHWVTPQPTPMSFGLPPPAVCSVSSNTFRPAVITASRRLVVYARPVSISNSGDRLETPQFPPQFPTIFAMPRNLPRFVSICRTWLSSSILYPPSALLIALEEHG